MAKHGDTTTSKEKTSGGGLSALAGLAATAASAYMTGGTSLLAGAGASALGGPAAQSVASGAFSNESLFGPEAAGWMSKVGGDG